MMNGWSIGIAVSAPAGYELEGALDVDRNYDTGGWDRRFDGNFDRNYDNRGWDRPPNHFFNMRPGR